MLDGEAPNFHKLAGILDARLGESAFLCGSWCVWLPRGPAGPRDDPTIADVAVAAPMHLHAWAKLPLENHANVVRWMSEGIETTPWWKATHVGEGFAVSEAA